MKREDNKEAMSAHLLLIMAETPRLAAAVISLTLLIPSGGSATAPLIDGLHAVADGAWTLIVVFLLDRETPTAWLVATSALGVLAVAFAVSGAVELASGERTEIADVGVARAAAVWTWLGGAASLAGVGLLTGVRRYRTLGKIEVPHLAIDFALTSGVLAAMWATPRAAWVDPAVTLLLACTFVWLAMRARQEAATARRRGHEGRA